MHLTLNAGIGDLILSHAMIGDAPVSVSIDDRAIVLNRSPEYREFAWTLLRTLFGSRVVEEYGDGLPPQGLVLYGFTPAVPDLRHVLPMLDGPPAPCVVVTTKVRGWPRRRYEAIRQEFLARLSKIRRLVLVGERAIGRNAEYVEHGEDKIYSIYDDLKLLPCLDATVPELGITPPRWADFRLDCTRMAYAERVITLGSGGNVSMAMACSGNCLVHADGTEMESLFRAMPASDRVRMCSTDAEYLEALL